MNVAAAAVQTEQLQPQKQALLCASLPPRLAFALLEGHYAAAAVLVVHHAQLDQGQLPLPHEPLAAQCWLLLVSCSS
jgi:hypothetical protein